MRIMAKFLRIGNITRIDRLDNGQIMCCICFRFCWKEELNPLANGQYEDVCLPCAELEKHMMKQQEG